jgi:hypothetical protein
MPIPPSGSSWHYAGDPHQPGWKVGRPIQEEKMQHAGKDRGPAEVAGLWLQRRGQ